MSQKDSSVITVSAKEMEQRFSAILLKEGFPPDKAFRCAEIFTSNTVDGIATHGVNRFSRFVDYIRKGYIDIKAVPTLQKKFGGIEQWNGNLGPGVLNAVHATESVMKLATEFGIGCVALSNTNHWMRGGTYGWQAAKAGYVFIAWTNTIANMPAWGGSNAKLGNNPLVVALPYQNEAIILDMAMSQFSFGAMELAEMKKEKLSVMGGFDRNDRLTDDPSAILETRRPLPVGYWKGAGLALLLDLLATCLSGGLATHEISKQVVEHSVSQVFIAIDLSKLGSHSAIANVIVGVLRDYESSVPIDESKRITYPGERVLQTRKRNLENGIQVMEKVWEEILKL